MKKSTIYSLAKELGVSPSTVSRSFDPSSRVGSKTRAKVLQLAKEKNFIMNTAAARLSSRALNIGAIFSDSYPFAVDEFLNGIRKAHRDLYDLNVNFEYVLVGEGTPPITEALDRFRGYDGLLISGFADNGSAEAMEAYIAGGGKVVLLQNDIQNVDRVFAAYHNFEKASEIAAQYIYDCLCLSERRKVVLITDSLKMDNQIKTKNAFSSSVSSLGLDFRGAYDMDGSEVKLKEIAGRLLADEASRPDAVFITSGKSRELCRYIEEHRLSGNVVVVAYDKNRHVLAGLKNGTVWAVIDQRFFHQAQNAFTGLVGELLGTSSVSDIVIDPEILLRSSI